MVTVKDWWYSRDLGNKTLHLKGSRGKWYQDHMLDLLVRYQDEEVNEKLTFEDETDIYLELVPRSGRFKEWWTRGSSTQH